MTAVNSASSSTINTSRMSGLASGMDIDTIVRDMITAERIALDKLEQQKQILQWQQEDYRTLNSVLYDFKNSLFNMKLESTFDTKAADSSNNSVATVKAGASAIEGSYAITINSLASGVSKVSTSALADEKDSNGNTLSLFDQFTEFAIRGFNSTDNITINLNGTELEIDLDQDNINTVVSKINSADLGVRASYDTTLNRFFLTTTTTGSDSEIIITEDSANFFSNGGNNSILKLNINDSVIYNGQNASIDFGDAAGLESDTNSITVNGITLNLKSEGSSTINVTRDIDAVVESVKEFVNSYNKTLSTLYSKVQEKRDREYLPLTDTQKEEMSDDEIKKWETKASSGLLRNDMLLQNIINNFRGAMYRTVEGVDKLYNSFSEIGITTGSYTENGKLYINETLLREALAKDSDSVKQMFTKTSENQNEKGISSMLYELTTDGIKYISDKAGSSSSFSSVDDSYIGKRLTEKNNAIEKWEKRLEALEDKYYSQFTTMETMINQMNIQSAWLSAQFGSGS